MNGARTYREFLQDIIDASTICLDFVEGLGFTDYLQDLKTMQAVTRQIGIIGEAANQIPDNVRLMAPDVSWGQIIGMRNRLIHEYFAVDHEIVWRTIQNDLVPLISSIRRLLDNSRLTGETPGV